MTKGAYPGLFVVAALAVQAVQGNYKPVNYYHTAESPDLQPELECVVGIHSASTSELYRVRCNEVKREYPCEIIMYYGCSVNLKSRIGFKINIKYLS